ncbi:MAG: hypothetical protein KKC19_01280 [Nanoarchaeota archaeon]|nr:hypothetical protein [Nanoarchaeota archaeon]
MESNYTAERDNRYDKVTSNPENNRILLEELQASSSRIKNLEGRVSMAGCGGGCPECACSYFFYAGGMPLMTTLLVTAGGLLFPASK